LNCRLKRNNAHPLKLQLLFYMQAENLILSAKTFVRAFTRLVKKIFSEIVEKLVKLGGGALPKNYTTAQQLFKFRFF